MNLNSRFKTSACRGVLFSGVCKRANCTFAHSLEELRCHTCRYGNDCSNENCPYQHPSESITDYYTRRGKPLPNIPKTSAEVQKPQVEEFKEGVTEYREAVAKTNAGGKKGKTEKVERVNRLYLRDRKNVIDMLFWWSKNCASTPDVFEIMMGDGEPLAKVELILEKLHFFSKHTNPDMTNVLISYRMNQATPERMCTIEVDQKNAEHFSMIFGKFWTVSKKIIFVNAKDLKKLDQTSKADKVDDAEEKSDSEEETEVLDDWDVPIPKKGKLTNTMHTNTNTTNSKDDSKTSSKPKKKTPPKGKKLTAPPAKKNGAAKGKKPPKVTESGSPDISEDDLSDDDS